MDATHPLPCLADTPRPVRRGGHLQLLRSGPPGPEPCSTTDLVHQARLLSGLEVAFLSEFVAGVRVIRAIDAAGTHPLAQGERTPLPETLCQRILDGRLPHALPDAAAHPESRALPATTALGIRSHVGVLVRRADGSLYGSLCCFDPRPGRVHDRHVLRLAHVARLIGSSP